MNTKDSKIMEFLYRQAVDHYGCSGFKMVSAIVIKGKIISVGVNQKKTHPIQEIYGKNKDSIFLHSEIASIARSLNHLDKSDLSKSNLYTFRVKRPNNKSKRWVSGLAKPCIGCRRALIEFEIPRIIFSTEDNRKMQIMFLKDLFSDKCEYKEYKW